MSDTLTHSPADILRYMLIDLGLGTLPTDAGSWPVFATFEADTPDNAITTYNEAPIHLGRSQISGLVYERYGMQIAVRAVDNNTGWNKIYTIAATLDQSVYEYHISISSSTYTVHSCSRSSGPIDAGKGKPVSKRNLFTLNITAMINEE